MPLRVFHQSKRHSKLLNLGSVVITRDSIFIGAGYSPDSSASVDEPAEQSFANPLSKVEFDYAAELTAEQPACDSDKDMLDTALRELALAAPHVTHLVVSAFGPFEKFGRRFLRANDQGYGRFRKNSNYPKWEGKKLYTIANKLSGKHFLCIQSVLIAVDVNVSALGEQYGGLEHQIKDGEISQSEAVSTAKSTTAYIKVSNSVNVGFTDKAWIGYGSHHPYMSVVRPVRRKNDKFKGTCRSHGDCFQGLISIDAIKARFVRRNLLSRWLEDPSKISMNSIPPNHAHWDIHAEYIAEICFLTTAMLAPNYITLGGAVLYGPFSYDTPSHEGVEWRNKFIGKIRSHFQNKISSGHPDPEKFLPFYSQMEDLDNFIRYRRSIAPGLFGGLMVARWSRDETYPVTFNQQGLKAHSIKV